MARWLLEASPEARIMEGSKTILVPIDFEEASVEALDQARDLAETLGFEVVLLHVYSVPATFYSGVAPMIGPGLSEEIRLASAETLAKFAAEHGNLRAILRCGDPTTETLAAIEELSPEMVVMGTHGRTGLSHFLLGSVAENVVRKSPVPVLTLRATGS
jgi:nucleotide-binding universal stress UspA family protein